MYYSDNPIQFRNIVLNELGYKAQERENYILYQNSDSPENGYYRLYQRERYYDLGIADYSIDHAFAVQFDNPEPLLRLGIVHEGVTRFKLKGQQASSFMPSTFLVLEEGIRGKQVWERGQHFQGAEITVYPAFFEELSSRFKDFSILDYFIVNHTYHYLPADILPVLHRVIYLDQENLLNEFHLEAAILECIGVIKESGKPEGQNAFSRQVDYGGMKIGRDRKLSFSAQDFKTIQNIHELLTEQFAHPPTMEALGRQFLMNPQKIKAGFQHYYHMTASEYTSSLKMTMAASLLCTTEKSVAEIANEVGYRYPSNFIKKFCDTYSCTPLKYRKREKKPIIN